MLLQGIKVGFAFTGSFCTFDKVMPELERIAAEGADIMPIISESVNNFDTKFGKADYWKSRIEGITGKKLVGSIVEAEPIGPKSLLDILVVAPCTGNTLGKLANGITDTPVTMACKAQLRNNKPVVIAVSTNDGLGINAKNLGILLNMKNIYFVPFGQDDPVKKCNSILADMGLITLTVLEALKGKQLQPLLTK